MKKISIWLVVVFICSTLTAIPLGVPISAKSAVLINADNGKILFAKNPDDKKYPGSLTKIATCLVAMKKTPIMEDKVRSPWECLMMITQKVKIEHQYQDPPYRLEPDGTSYGIVPGEVLTMKDLFYGMMLVSGNDASNVVAYHLSNGDINAYMKDVNEYLHSIGCTNTQFYNPHGLHYPKHVSTAKDLAYMVKEAIKIPGFVDVVSAVEYERPKTNKQGARIITNSNKLLNKGPLYYPKAFGVKRGFHSLAGHNFAGAAKDETRTVVAVVLQCPNFQEAFKDTIRLFEAAFNEQQLTRQLFNSEEHVFTTSVKGAASTLKARLHEDVFIRYFPSEEEELLPELHWNDLKAPVTAGESVGEIRVVTKDGKILKTSPIYAVDNVALSFFPHLAGLMRKYYIILSCFALACLIMGIVQVKKLKHSVS